MSDSISSCRSLSGIFPWVFLEYRFLLILPLIQLYKMLVIQRNTQSLTRLTEEEKNSNAKALPQSITTKIILKQTKIKTKSQKLLLKQHVIVHTVLFLLIFYLS